MKQYWRPTLAFTITAILASHFILLKIVAIFMNAQLSELPTEFWGFATAYCVTYGVSRGFEKTKGKSNET